MYDQQVPGLVHSYLLWRKKVIGSEIVKLCVKIVVALFLAVTLPIGMDVCAEEDQRKEQSSPITVPPISTDEWRSYFEDNLKLERIVDEKQFAIPSQLSKLRKLHLEDSQDLVTRKKSGQLTREALLRHALRTYTLGSYMMEMDQAKDSERWMETSKSLDGLRNALESAIDRNIIRKSAENFRSSIDDFIVESIKTRVESRYDQFRKVTTIVGPDIGIAFLGKSLLIRAEKSDRDGSIAFQIYIRDRYSGQWRFYSAAYDDSGMEIDLTALSRRVDSCQQSTCFYIEDVGLNVSKRYLEEKRYSGVRFKILGNYGEEILEIGSPYIRAILSSVTLHSARSK